MAQGRSPFPGTQRRIVGHGNQILYGHAVLNAVAFDIEGDDNYIQIEAGCFLNGVRFFLRGNGHQVKIGGNCRFSGGG